MHPSLNKSGLHLRWRLGRCRWAFFRVCLLIKTIFHKNKSSFGKRISLQGKLRIHGPGKVILHDDVIISDQVDLFTHHPSAVIEIGPRTFLNGSRIAAQKKIQIGADNIIADVRMMDTDFHWLHAQRNFETELPPAQPILTEQNVWVAAGSAILKGSVIGKNSVIGFGSVVTGQKIPPDQVWAGSPARFIAQVPANREPHE